MLATADVTDREAMADVVAEAADALAGSTACSIAPACSRIELIALRAPEAGIAGAFGQGQGCSGFCSHCSSTGIWIS